MYSLELLITIGLATLIIGAALGYFIAQRTSVARRSQQQLQSQLNELQQQAEHYRQEVTEHFSETAELLNQLTDSYRNVHQHLAKGAQTLTTDSNARSTLKMISVDGEPARTTEKKHSLTPPLDYVVTGDVDDLNVSDDYSDKNSTKTTRR